MPNAPARPLVLACAAVAGIVTVSAQQSARTGPAFDVSSVKRFVPSPERRPSDSISVMPGGRFTAPGATLRGLITAAYGIFDIQIIDSGRIPADERFEIEATTKAGVTADQARAMLRTLLAERFRLSAHAEIRELPVYILTVAREDRRLGEQLRLSGPDCAPIKGPAGLPPPPPRPPTESIAGVLTLGGPPRCGGLRYSSSSGEHLSLRGLTMASFAQTLIRALERPVLDRTALEGMFDVDITYTPDTQVVAGSNLLNAPSLPTAMREQLGLRLESSKAPVQVLVIDAIEAPTEN